MADASLIARQLLSDLRRDFGLTDAQAAGVVGNLMHESGNFEHLQEINPVVPGSRGGWGFAQWTGQRRKSFDNYVEREGLDPGSYEANYGFLKHEVANNRYERGNFNQIKRAETAEEAARIFSKEYLRPGTPHMGSRLQYTATAAELAALPPLPPGSIPNVVGTQLDTKRVAAPKSYATNDFGRMVNTATGAFLPPSSPVMQSINAGRQAIDNTRPQEYPNARTVMLPVVEPSKLRNSTAVPQSIIERGAPQSASASKSAPQSIIERGVARAPQSIIAGRNAGDAIALAPVMGGKQSPIFDAGYDTEQGVMQRFQSPVGEMPTLEGTRAAFHLPPMRSILGEPPADMVSESMRRVAAANAVQLPPVRPAGNPFPVQQSPQLAGQRATDRELQTALTKYVQTPQRPAAPIARTIGVPQTYAAQEVSRPAPVEFGIGRPPATRVVQSVPVPPAGRLQVAQSFAGQDRGAPRVAASAIRTPALAGKVAMAAGARPSVIPGTTERVTPRAAVPRGGGSVMDDYAYNVRANPVQTRQTYIPGPDGYQTVDKGLERLSPGVRDNGLPLYGTIDVAAADIPPVLPPIPRATIQRPTVVRARPLPTQTANVAPIPHIRQNAVATRLDVIPIPRPRPNFGMGGVDIDLPRRVYAAPRSIITLKPSVALGSGGLFGALASGAQSILGAAQGGINSILGNLVADQKAGKLPVGSYLGPAANGGAMFQGHNGVLNNLTQASDWWQVVTGQSDRGRGDGGAQSLSGTQN